MRTLPKVQSCRLGSEVVFEAQRFGFGAVAENKLRQNIAESILDDKRVLGGSWEFSKQVHKGDTWGYCVKIRKSGSSSRSRSSGWSGIAVEMHGSRLLLLVNLLLRQLARWRWRQRFFWFIWLAIAGFSAFYTLTFLANVSAADAAKWSFRN